MLKINLSTEINAKTFIQQLKRQKMPYNVQYVRGMERQLHYAQMLYSDSFITLDQLHKISTKIKNRVCEHVRQRHSMIIITKLQ